MDNETKNALAALQDAYDEATAESGGRDPWPGTGMHQCYIHGLTLDRGEFRQRDGDPLPATVIFFSYELVDDPDRDPALQWRGTPTFLPDNPKEILNEKSKTRFKIGLNHLKGQIKNFLGRVPGNLLTDLNEIQEILAGDVAVMANVFVDHRQDRQNPDNVYRTDSIKEILSGPSN